MSAPVVPETSFPFLPISGPDQMIAVAGAGVIGLSIALELRNRGYNVAVLEPGQAMRQASWAAAGMLAVEDPHNPEELKALARLSRGLYSMFLERIEALSGLPVPFHTSVTWQYGEGGPPRRLEEHSIDPRQLAEALPVAVRKAGVQLHEGVGKWDFAETDGGVLIRTHSGVEFKAAALVHASGAWFAGRQMIRPRKGQIFRVKLPEDLRLSEVHRRSDVYVVPRTTGPRQGTAVIGATVEDAGFDAQVSGDALRLLRAKAAVMVPEIADETRAPVLESWVGFRPSTADELPLLGALPGRRYEMVATGHFRNGILLAPATAQVVADMLQGREPAVDVNAFSPARAL